MNNIFHFLGRSAEKRPQATALVDRELHLSYADFASAVERAAAGFVSLGLQRHDRVAIYLDKCSEGVIAMLGAMRAGLIMVPVNPKLKPGQVAHIIRDCSAGVLVTTPFRLSQLAETVDLKTLHVIAVGKDLPLVQTRSTHAWSDLCVGKGPGVRLHRTIAPDACAILYTSGSTGMPKGVTVTHGNLIAGAESANEYLLTNPDDAILSLLPLSFDAGLSQLTTAMAAQARLVLLNFMRPQEVVATCAREQVTSITGVPPLWMQLVSVPWGEDATRAIRLFANTGGHMPRPLLERLRSTFPKARPYLMYGLTEAFRSTYLDPEEIDRRPDSIGKAIPNAEILVLRADGTPCEADEPGELVHRGPHVALGYWNDAARTAERYRPLPQAVAQGLVPEIAVWSGDFVRMDSEGFIYFIGRRDEMIKSSGYRISPMEIEAVLFATPSVREAAVFAMPDEALGQRIIAAVAGAEAGLDQAAVLKHCSHHLPSYMVPELFEMNELPRTPNGKIDRSSLAGLYAAAKRTAP